MKPRNNVRPRPPPSAFCTAVLPSQESNEPDAFAEHECVMTLRAQKRGSGYVQT